MAAIKSAEEGNAMVEDTRETMSPERSGLTRRSIVKGAAWSLPVIAVPAQAASLRGCGSSETRVITATDAARGELTVTIPACAETITFRVLGGGGGASGLPGGAGALITGTIQATGADMTVTLIAGQMGWSRGSTKVNVNPTGFGSGGLGGNRFSYNGNGIWLVDAGYGGAGSAILTDTGAPLVIAGGGGGGSNATTGPTGGSIEAGAGGAGGLVPQGGASGHVGGGSFANGGGPANDAVGGAGGVAAPGTYTGVNGAAGGGAAPGTGGRGAEGPGESGTKAGGGGGGYAGGGGGSVAYRDVGNGAGSGGGAGSNLVTSVDGVVAVANAGGITTGAWEQGTVSITWS